MKQPTKQMAREYRNIAKHCEWTWRENKKDQISYLYLAGHRLARVYHYAFNYQAHCPGGLVAYRKTIASAKSAAVSAVLAWLNEAVVAVRDEPREDHVQEGISV